MKVRQLIKELKKMPQDAIVGTANADHCEYDVDDWVSSADLMKKGDIEDIADHGLTVRDFEQLPNVYVILRG